MFLKALPTFLECVIIDENLLHSKLEKYLKRYLGNKFGVVPKNNFKQYLSILQFKSIILSLEDYNDFKEILNFYQELQIIILQNAKYFKIFTKHNLLFIQFPKLNAFDEKRNKIYKGKILADDLAEKIARFIKDKEQICLSDGQQNITEISNKQKYCSLRLLYKNDPNDIIFRKNVGEFRIKLGEMLAEELTLKEIDYIVPVPSSGIFYAVGLSKILKIPFMPALKKLNVSERAFEVQNVDMRKNYLYQNMQINFHLIKNKKIILVDEAIFTGATLKVVCDILQDSGVAEIHLAIPSPKCFFKCNYLVQPRRTLLLDRINEQYMANYFGVKTVNFLSLKAYKEFLQKVNKKMCIECFEK